MKSTLVVGTRGSELALVQASATEAALSRRFPDLNLRREIIKTTGDRRTDVALSEVAKSEGVFDKGVFIKELELALEAKEIDIAVHSLKDVPTVLESEFCIAAVLERAPMRDVLLTRNGGGIADLPQGAIVGTSSVRRAKQIEWLRPDIKTIDLRGNVPTRLRKLAGETTYDAIILAEAGLVRLGYLPTTGEGDEVLTGDEPSIAALHALRLPENEFYPAAGQGAVGLETRAADSVSRELVRSINHHETWLRVTAEREFLRLLEGGCSTPVGVFTHLEGDVLAMSARVFPDAGGTPRTAHASGPAEHPLAVALELFEALA